MSLIMPEYLQADAPSFLLTLSQYQARSHLAHLLMPFLSMSWEILPQVKQLCRVSQASVKQKQVRST